MPNKRLERISAVLRPKRSPIQPKICEPNSTPILLALSTKPSSLGAMRHATIRLGAAKAMAPMS